MLQSIPEEWQEFWEPVETPPEILVHYTPSHNVDAILASGHLRPHDPAPRDWQGLVAVFMCDTRDDSYHSRMRQLLSSHFHRHSADISVIYIRPPQNLMRCKLPERRSYHISLAPVCASTFIDHHPFSCRLPADKQAGMKYKK